MPGPLRLGRAATAWLIAIARRPEQVDYAA